MTEIKGHIRAGRRSFLLGLGLLAASPALAATHTVTVNTVQIFGTIDPAKISDYTDYMASANLYDGLANVDPNGDLVPELAEKWEVSPDASQRHLSHPARREIPGRLARSGRGRRLFGRAAAEDQSGPRQPIRRRAEAGQRRGDRRQDGQVQSRRRRSRRSSPPCRRFASSIPSSSRRTPGTTTARPILRRMSRAPVPIRSRAGTAARGMTIERDPNYYRGWGEGPIDEVRFVITNDEATVRSMAASGELTMSSQYQSPDTYDALAKMPRFKIVKGETSVAFYLKLNTQTRADRRRAYPQGDRARDRLRHDPRHDPARRRTDRSVAQDLRRGASRQPAAEIRSRGGQGRDRQERLCRQDRHSAQPHLRLVGQVRGGDRAADAVQSAADRLQGDALGRTVEPRHRNRLEGRDDAQCHRGLFRSDLPLAGLDVLHAV